MTHYAKPVSDFLTLNEFSIDDRIDYYTMGINGRHQIANTLLA
ncbi:hypothetical protein [Kistimonas scapharcae]